jgi:uncharacterized protein
VRLENTFDVPVAPAEAWRILTDVERVAPCVPGARLTEVLDDDAYKGTMQVKLGPVSLAFDGKAQFIERDDNAHTAKLRANGRETRNRGTADADVTFALEPQGDGTLVRIETELQLSGPIAQYGRSQGVILSVSEEMIDRFATALKNDILAADTSAASEAPATSPATDTPPPASGVSIGFGAVMRLIRRFFAGLFGKA